MRASTSNKWQAAAPCRRLAKLEPTPTYQPRSEQQRERPSAVLLCRRTARSFAAAAAGGSTATAAATTAAARAAFSAHRDGAGVSRDFTGAHRTLAGSSAHVCSHAARALAGETFARRGSGASVAVHCAACGRTCNTA